MKRATILGSGMYVPECVIPNTYFNEMYGEDVDAFLRKNRNIFERRYMTEDQTTSDLATAAAQKALEDAGVRPDQIRLNVLATDTPDYLSPSTSAVTQYKLGAVNAGTFDINTACAGFVTALDIGSKFVSATPEQYPYVLVIGAYGMSRYVDFRERNVATLFADGAGAVVIGPAEDESGILTSKLWADGQYHDYMGIYVGGACQPANLEAVQNQEHLLQFRKKFPKTFNYDLWTGTARDLAERAQVSLDDVDHFFFTQINYLTIQEVMEGLGQPMEKAHLVMDRFGYTGSACIPMVIADAKAQDKLKPNDLVFLIASGGGAALAAMALRWKG